MNAPHDPPSSFDLSRDNKPGCSNGREQGARQLFRVAGARFVSILCIKFAAVKAASSWRSLRATASPDLARGVHLPARLVFLSPCKPTPKLPSLLRSSQSLDPRLSVLRRTDVLVHFLHGLACGDASLSIGIDEATLFELAPADFLHTKDRTLFNRPRMRIDAHAQLLAALVRHRLVRGMTETLEAEDLVLSLISCALGRRASHAASGSTGR
jgi:hypothetical protein